MILMVTMALSFGARVVSRFGARLLLDAVRWPLFAPPGRSAAQTRNSKVNRRAVPRQQERGGKLL
jgi:hypothetical protein